jgi:methyl-accepting chemotaxis protein
MRLKISLRLRLLLTFLVVALVPIALIAALNASSVILLLREEVETHQIEATTLIASDIQSFADHLVYELTQAGQLALLRPGEPGGLLRDALYISSGYESVRLIDPNGDEIARLENGELARRADLTNLSADEIFFRPMRGETYFSALRVIDGSPSIDVAAPLVEGGTIIGVIAAEVRLNLPWEQIVGRVIGSTGYVLLTDRRGNVIAAPQAIDSSASLLNTPPMRAIFAGQTRAAAYEYISPITGLGAVH